MSRNALKFQLETRGPFSMEPVRKLQCGFLQGTRTCDASDGAVTVAFPQEGSYAPVAVRLRQGGANTSLEVEVFGSDDVERVRTQVARMLAVDCDARPFFEVLQEDEVLARLDSQRPAFRPVVASSPYAMAGWLVLSQRIQMTQAARLQQRLAEATGDVVDVDGERAVSFPSPEGILKLSGFAGISAEKWRRLQGVAAAALEGALRIERLLGMPYEEARESLMSIHGIGPWTADGILIRGCGPTDVLPLSETTLHGAIQAAYGLSRLPTDSEVVARAQAWKPFRTWMSVFLISANFAQAKALSRAREARA